MCGGILFCVLFVFLLFGLLMAILPLMGVNIELLHLVYCGIGVLIFSIYLIYDTQVGAKPFVCLFASLCENCGINTFSKGSAAIRRFSIN